MELLPRGRVIPGTRLSKSASRRNAVQGLTLRVAAQSTGMSLGTFSSISSGNTPRVRHVPGHSSTMGTATAGGKAKENHQLTLQPWRWQHFVLGTSYTLERELWNVFPYG